MAISTGQPRVFIWSPSGSSVCEIPNGDLSSQLSVVKVKWNPRGTTLILLDKNAAIVAEPSLEFMNNASTVIGGEVDYGLNTMDKAKYN